mmetsp:Transcript_73290/g.157015  ORF Transcript_73290/g.157015 Transcript_73290/m.157015 type:complete len:209 (-) Transcript_73290:2505-3131(-)
MPPVPPSSGWPTAPRDALSSPRAAPSLSRSCSIPPAPPSSGWPTAPRDPLSSPRWLGRVAPTLSAPSQLRFPPPWPAQGVAPPTGRCAPSKSPPRPRRCRNDASIHPGLRNSSYPKPRARRFEPRSRPPLLPFLPVPCSLIRWPKGAPRPPAVSSRQPRKASLRACIPTRKLASNDRSPPTPCSLSPRPPRAPCDASPLLPPSRYYEL